MSCHLRDNYRVCGTRRQAHQAQCGRPHPRLEDSARLGVGDHLPEGEV